MVVLLFLYILISLDASGENLIQQHERADDDSAVLTVV